ncbi:MAG: ABC transporter ATP-binding protein [Chloroflexi bacterium]|nr:ABC transporter ATP-binding protein [Chloroflexota bacterium]
MAAYGLRKVYGSVIALADLTLTVEEGEVFGFLGPNGAGKTTAMKLLLGLAHPTAGEAWLLGRPPSTREARQQVGFLPEHFRFHEWLRAKEFLDLHGRLYGMPLERRRRRVAEVLEWVGLAERANDQLHAFSKGMLQRIGIAQAMLNEPRLLFLDEPTSGLDPLGRREVRELIRKLKAQGVTVFLNSHLLSEVELVCDRVAIVNRGQVVRLGPLLELLAGQLEIVVQARPISSELLEALGQVGSILDTSDSTVTVAVENEERIPLLAEAVVQQGAKLYGLQRRLRSLEDLFIEVVAES